MGQARRRKLAGNTEPNPNWRRPLTREEIKEAVRKGVSQGVSDMMFMYRDMIKR